MCSTLSPSTSRNVLALGLAAPLPFNGPGASPDDSDGTPLAAAVAALTLPSAALEDAASASCGGRELKRSCAAIQDVH